MNSAIQRWRRSFFLGVILPLALCLSGCTENPDPVSVSQPLATPSPEPSVSDLSITPRELTPIGSAAIEKDSLLITKDGNGFSWAGTAKGNCQIWLTYYCGDRNAAARVILNGTESTRRVMYMGADIIRQFYDGNGDAIRPRQRTTANVGMYAFREYLGTIAAGDDVVLEITFPRAANIRIDRLELVPERPYRQEFDPLLHAALDFYSHQHEPGLLPAAGYDIGKQRRYDFCSAATAGIVLATHAINHRLGRDPKAADRALEILRMFNGKVPGIKPARHRTGFFMHFVKRTTGRGKSEYSTIDTSILVSGALMARNIFDDPRIRSEADELWRSIDWSAAVAEPDELSPRFYLTGAQIDGDEDRTIGMFNEYILLAWFCEKHARQKAGDRKRKGILPDLLTLPRAVYDGRILLSNRHGNMAPSFLVQFPFYLSELGGNELFFSYTAAQAHTDRSANLKRYNDPSAWGVGPGCTPERGYSVDDFGHNPENVVSPRLVAGFIPVMPGAADDLLARWKKPANRMELPFGTILPRFVPGKYWQPTRLAGIDFSSLLFGLASHHPDLGREFFAEATRFTFRRLGSDR